MTYNTDMEDDNNTNDGDDADAAAEAAANSFAYEGMGLKLGNWVIVDSIQRYEDDIAETYEGRLVQITDAGLGIIWGRDNEFVFIPWTSCAVVRGEQL